MLVCPLDYRYGRKIVKEIFSEESSLKAMVRVEVALLYAHEKLGHIPEGCAEKVEKATENIKLSRVKEIENEIRHDVMAVVKAMAELSGECGKYIHLGATSNDIIDTATALKLKNFINVLEEDMKALEDVLESMTEKYRHTVMLGRTHGQAAVPITFGLKMANYLAEILRHHQRLRQLKPRILVCKMMGAVGTGAALGSQAMEIQELVAEYLGLGVEESPTQLIARDRYVELVSFIAGVATTLEKIATEIRNLQRTEINEVQEGFDEKKQVGSSTMAQKKNPIVSENVCGLARIIRGFIVPMHESAVLWHERDLTNSSAERFIIPHVCVLIDDILVKMQNVLANLKVNEEIMLKNLRNHEEIMAERIIIYLVEQHGWSRQEAHEKLRQIAMRPGTFRDNLQNDPEIGALLKEHIDELLNPKTYTGVSDRIINKILEKKREF
ncbi:MAG: adenylosuccinate lyase [Euryarchaeota archaeon]|nr:adenylosuccinate lyase [Euryarchaeota archaeon]